MGGVSFYSGGKNKIKRPNSFIDKVIHFKTQLHNDKSHEFVFNLIIRS